MTDIVKTEPLEALSGATLKINAATVAQQLADHIEIGLPPGIFTELKEAREIAEGLHTITADNIDDATLCLETMRNGARDLKKSAKALRDVFTAINRRITALENEAMESQVLPYANVLKEAVVAYQDAEKARYEEEKRLAAEERRKAEEARRKAEEEERERQQQEAARQRHLANKRIADQILEDVAEDDGEGVEVHEAHMGIARTLCDQGKCYMWPDGRLRSSAPVEKQEIEAAPEVVVAEPVPEPPKPAPAPTPVQATAKRVIPKPQNRGAHRRVIKKLHIDDESKIPRHPLTDDTKDGVPVKSLTLLKPEPVAIRKAFRAGLFVPGCRWEDEAQLV